MIFKFTAVALAASLISSAFGSDVLTSRAADVGTSDVCGELFNEPLKVVVHGRSVTVGYLSACLCVSGIPGYIAANGVTIAAVALVGKPTVTNLLTNMINGCNGHQTCRYPTHSVPSCAHGNPCSFTCKDGYTPYPSYKPTSCVCNKPYTECNGKCGIFHGCPSAHYKRELVPGKSQTCKWGHTACGVLGRGSQSWDCVDTQTDLESCGGCVISLASNPDAPEGQDCTAIAGVSDVSCVRGACVVHRCDPGYKLQTNDAGVASCVYSEEHDPVILASQYGLEHVPL